MSNVPDYTDWPYGKPIPPEDREPFVKALEAHHSLVVIGYEPRYFIKGASVGAMDRVPKDTVYMKYIGARVVNEWQDVIVYVKDETPDHSANVLSAERRERAQERAEAAAHLARTVLDPAPASAYVEDGDDEGWQSA